MIQQINLYQLQDDGDISIFKNPYVLSILAVVLILSIASVSSFKSLQNNVSMQKQLQADVQSAQTHLQELQTRYPNQQIDATLNQELHDTQIYYQNLSQTLELLSDTQSDQSRGFSRYLSALAAQIESDVWLTAIRINSEDQSIALSGSTFKPQRIPQLLQRLQLESAFKGRHFARLTVLQSADDSAQVDFSVSSSQEPQTGEVADGKH